MKNTTVGVFLVVVITSLFWGTNATETDVIYWSPSYKLTWNDFEGSPNYQHDYKDVSAITFSGIVDYRGCENEKIIYKIKSYFEKKNSWVKMSGRNSHTLEHEQIHFDITELYARKLRKALSERSFACGQEEAFEAFIEEFLKDWQKMQEDYDVETGYSNIHTQQHDWERRVKEQMKLFEDYKSE